jgi:hypothetical protein
MKSELEINEKKVLIDELKDVCALVETCHAALKHHSVFELEPVERSLRIAYTNLYNILRLEQSILENLDKCNHLK